MVPLRSDGEIHETRFMAVDRQHQMPHGRVHVTQLAVKQRQLHGGKVARLRFQKPPDDAGTSAGGVDLLDRFKGLSRNAMGLCVLDVLRHVAIEIAHGPIGASEMLACDEVSGIQCQSLVRPRDGILIPALIPVRHRNRLMHERREGVAFERSQLHLETVLQPAQRIQEPAVQHVGFGVVGIDLERALQAPLGADPVPLAQKRDRAQRHLRVRTGIVQGERAERGGSGSCKPARRRDQAQLRLLAAGQREARMSGGERRIHFDGGLVRGDRLRRLGPREQRQMNPAASDQLVDLKATRRP